MSLRFKYALILTICCAVLHLVLFMTGFETVRLGVGHHLFWLIQVLMAVVLWKGIKAARYESFHGGLSYGQGVWTGVVISFYSALLSAAYDFVHFRWINTRFEEYQLACLKEQWAASATSAADVDKATQQLHFAMSPLPHAAISVVVTVLFGLVLSLIIAAFLKHPAYAGTSPQVKVV